MRWVQLATARGGRCSDVPHRRPMGGRATCVLCEHHGVGGGLALPPQFAGDALDAGPFGRVLPSGLLAQVGKVARRRSQFASQVSSTSRAATASIASTASSVLGCSSFHEPSLRSMNSTRQAHAARLLPSGNG
jgi:hypothetical protein